MTTSRVRLVCALALLAAAAGHARAQPTDDAAATAFVKRLVDAINSKSLDRRRALVHPKALRCASGEPGSAYEWAATRQARQAVPAEYRWKITRVPAGQPPMFADRFDYPVPPTHVLQLDFDTGPNASTTQIYQIVYDAARWGEVAACPKPETIEAARSARETRAKHAEKVKALAAGAPPELKETVVRLVEEGRRIDAFKRYSSATGEDLATAKDVVELLAAPAR